jgi:hypothetical protein
VLEAALRSIPRWGLDGSDCKAVSLDSGWQNIYNVRFCTMTVNIAYGAERYVSGDRRSSAACRSNGKAHDWLD